MEPEFWRDRWARNQIGFHRPDVNPYLPKHWPQLQLPAGAKVLVPLCGKSLDLIWLADQGHRVMGVELSELAVNTFFDEQKWEPQISEQGAFKRYQAGSIEVWCGDLFDLRPEDVADCRALYDRAALIALPPPMRPRYARHLSSLLVPGCQGLMITLDYDKARKDGPPFAVSDAEVNALLGDAWSLEVLEEQHVPSDSGYMLADGVRYRKERAYHLVRSRA